MTGQIIKTRSLYGQAVPEILKYQLLTSAMLGILLSLLKTGSKYLLASAGRVAVSTGDFLFIFTSWQGILLILAGLVFLFLFVAFDLNTKIIWSEAVIRGEKIRILACMKEGFLSIRKFLCLNGLGIVLYVALIAPVLGFGLSISLTEGLFIPTFITSVIQSTPLYNMMYMALTAVFTMIGVAHIFCIHGVVISGLSIPESRKQSSAVIKKNWKDFALQNLKYLAFVISAFFLILILFLILPMIMMRIIDVSDEVFRTGLIFFCLLTITVILLGNALMTPFYVLRITGLYYRYTGQEAVPVRSTERRRHWFSGVIAVVSAAVLLFFAARFVNEHFDEVFPAGTEVKIVAHRGGGSEAPENTVKGIEAAYEAGAWGSEIDIQRTKDGHYVVCHDSTFKRLCGVSRKPEEMTYEETRELRVRDPNVPGSAEPVPDLEEMLDAAKGKVILFIELKGNTADRKMADDVIRSIREHGMEEQCVVISLKYDLINYAETTYPEIKTGYLTFASFGNTASLNCDYLGLEEESASPSVIEAVHAQDKKVLVWTPNEEESQKNFLLSKADGIITDEVFQAKEIIWELENSSDLERILDWLVIRLMDLL